MHKCVGIKQHATEQPMDQKRHQNRKIINSMIKIKNQYTNIYGMQQR